MEFLKRLLQVPASSFFLFGPRGTGKTTWLQQRFAEALWIDLLRPDVYRRMSARPERLAELVRATPADQTVVLDEIQRVPELLNVVHHLIESEPTRRFVMTGSSARKLRKGGVDLLAGRAVMRSLHPFLAAELPAFDLGQGLRYGLLPLVRAASDPEDVLAAYATLYMEQEVKVEGWVRNLGAFARFLEALSFSHGATLNLSNVARDCQVERRTAAGYLEVLEDMLLAFRIPVFTRRASRRTSVHPKFFYFDTGVFRSLRPAGPLDRPEEIEGAALEGLLAQHLRAWIAYAERNLALYTWRTPRGSEIDFILYGADGFLAIEVKNTGQVRSGDLRALRAFRREYPSCQSVLLYRGEERLLRDDVLCLPVGEFLRGLHPGRDPGTLGVRQESHGK